MRLSGLNARYEGRIGRPPPTFASRTPLAEAAGCIERNMPGGVPAGFSMIVAHDANYTYTANMVIYG